jgi:methyl-accepting chemotaxis protein
MTTFILILALVVISVVGGLIYAQKTNKIADKDGDLIPDAIEEKVEEVKEAVKEVKTRAKKVATEVGDVAKAVKEVAKQSKDVVNAAKTSTGARRGRKPAQK